MRRIAANYIFPVASSPIKNGIIEIDESGKVLNLIDSSNDFRESRNVEFYNGVIVPGFINTHCHLELSEHKGKIEEGNSLPNFLKDVFHLRKDHETVSSKKSISTYDSIMSSNGIVAVGDICNTNMTIETKLKSKIKYYSFIEVIGIENSDLRFKESLELLNQFETNKLPSSIVAHAPYSVSNKLFQFIKGKSENTENILSIHNQETESENEMFESKSGELFEMLISLGVDYNSWNSTGRRSLESIKDLLPKNNHILFVHNTYSTEKDLNLIDINFKNAYLCLCPLSNIYIENCLPDILIFLKYSNKITLGTDSLASNKILSILEEMKCLKSNYEDLEFDTLLQWATINGAKALKLDSILGSIEIGKTPGLNLITDFDFQQMTLKETSSIKSLA